MPLIKEKPKKEKLIKEKPKQRTEWMTLALPDSDESFTMTLSNGGMSDDQFFDFCQLNKNFRIERNSKREIIIMALTGGKTGTRNFRLYIPFGNWMLQGGHKGEFFDSSTGFKLPNGATYSPDLAWVPDKQWNVLTDEQQRKFVPLCPDFMAELLSSEKERRIVREKVEEFVENGCRLAWLIDPFEKVTHVFRPMVEVEKVPFSQPLFGGQVLEGFQLKMEDLLGS